MCVMVWALTFHSSDNSLWIPDDWCFPTCHFTCSHGENLSSISEKRAERAVDTVTAQQSLPSRWMLSVKQISNCKGSQGKFGIWHIGYLLMMTLLCSLIHRSHQKCIRSQNTYILLYQTCDANVTIVAMYSGSHHRIKLNHGSQNALHCMKHVTIVEINVLILDGVLWP